MFGSHYKALTNQKNEINRKIGGKRRWREISKYEEKKLQGGYTNAAFAVITTVG
jgi:hypothetical protein